MFHNNNHLESDILSDENGLLNNDKEIIYSHEIDLYNSNFKKFLFKFIDEK